MKNKNLEFGFFILSIGIVSLLVNTGIIKWSIVNAFLELWPAILIVIGINIIFHNNSIIRIITWLLFLGAIVLYGYFYDSVWESPVRDLSGISNISIEKYTEMKKVM